MSDLVARDSRFVWHPYSAVTCEIPPLGVVSASGATIELEDGRCLVDGMSSWWAAIHGYNHPVLNEAAKAQIDDFAHVMFGGLTHRPAVDVCTQLARMAPGDLQRVFLADSGSVSIEVAVKMAIQYQQARGLDSRTELLTWRGGYHGDTATCMSVCDPEGGMHSLWTDVLKPQIFAPVPPTDYCEEYVRQFEQLAATHADRIAGVIIEPVVQGAGGMRFHDPALVAAVRRVCDEHGFVFIADEIATGFGRTGELFAVDHAGVVPDILCVGKALTGGYVSLAAAITTEHIAQTICSGPGGAIMHGPTFMGNPLACAIAVASLELIQSGYWETAVPFISRQLQHGLQSARELPSVADVRVLGAIGVIELFGPVDMGLAQRIASEHGVWLRPFRNLVYCMPPYISSQQELTKITAAMTAIASAHPAS